MKIKIALARSVMTLEEEMVKDLNKVVQIIPIFEATPTASFSGLSLI